MFLNISNFTYPYSRSLQFRIGLFLLRCCGCKTNVPITFSNTKVIIKALLVFLGFLISKASIGAQLITVNPQAQYNVSGQNDLKLIRQYSREASWESSITNETWNKLKLLGVSKTRMINVETENSVLINPRTRELHYEFSDRLLAGLTNCKAYGLIPHIIVGQVPQKTLASGVKDGKYFGISNWAAYQNYAHAFLEFVMITKGFLEADFEVANEPDINGASWLLPDNLHFGDPKMYSAYLKLYEVWANAADELEREHPGLKIRIGGPSITPFSYAYGPLNWAEQFTKDIVARQLRLDFMSFHFYGNQQALSGLTEFGEYPSINRQVDFLRERLGRVGLKNMPLYATEWGPSSDINETPKGIINGNHVGAAWMARFLLDMAENNVDEGSLLVFRDYTHPGKSLSNWGWASQLLSDGVTPKPLYNVALMFSRLPGQRVNTFPKTQGSVGLIASADNLKVGILAFNQNWDFQNSRELAKSDQLQVRVSGLPFATSRVRVLRYVIDSTHNAYYLKQRRISLTAQNTGLQKVYDQFLPVSNGIVNLPYTTLQPSSVTLWEITAG